MDEEVGKRRFREVLLKLPFFSIYQLVQQTTRADRSSFQCCDGGDHCWRPEDM